MKNGCVVVCATATLRLASHRNAPTHPRCLAKNARFNLVISGGNIAGMLCLDARQGKFGTLPGGGQFRHHLATMRCLINAAFSFVENTNWKCFPFLSH
jgi:hypothetical protein